MLSEKLDDYLRWIDVCVKKFDDYLRWIDVCVKKFDDFLRWMTDRIAMGYLKKRGGADVSRNVLCFLEHSRNHSPSLSKDAQPFSFLEQKKYWFQKKDETVSIDIAKHHVCMITWFLGAWNTNKEVGFASKRDLIYEILDESKS